MGIVTFMLWIILGIMFMIRFISIMEMGENPYRLKSFRWRLSRPIMTGNKHYNCKEVVERFYKEVYPSLPRYAKIAATINVKSLFINGKPFRHYSTSSEFNITSEFNYRSAIIIGILLLPYKVVDISLSIPICMILIPIEYILYSGDTNKNLSEDITLEQAKEKGIEISILNRLY